LFERAKNNPVGELAYDPEKSIGVIKLVAEKAGWGKQTDGVYQGFSTYYSHNTYVAEIADVVMSKGQPKVTKVTVAIDCGIVVNPIAAINQAQGGVIDGVGHALYGDFSFESGKPSAANFDTYRLIRMKESPQVDIHFVESNNSPTGLGEPTLPPAGGAIANAIYAATGKRLYKQPFTKQDIVSS
jgi:isoquinoline 1-oxidoreductase beta subunit